ncbi:amino acid adenylation domain protein [Leptolyngbya sp. Heron Island J]|uniref:non-ribosomal peptide synthetase n=1 Tax=Leptolyngbya sp. Heron Island J TaxID=1385935 RepID=UPI0003B95AC3|nr:non-ribosomal peptide synthetase [Leptolyngbya sp. Heron Island J]ESA35630.1 amino acid adenylation domain protein [Leptolyngbya sp. Heron Island J]
MSALNSSQRVPVMTKRNIEDIYPLSPLQQGLLFHTLYSAQPGVYVTQLCLTFKGNLNCLALQKAWQTVANRHPIFRTFPVWKKCVKPVQIVRREISLPWQQLDWCSLSDSQQQIQLDALLESDRQQGFDLNQAPLMRFVLIQLSRDVYSLVWSYHHILLDGWSMALVLQEVFDTYTANLAGKSVPQIPPFSYHSYVVWLEQQNQEESLQFWREALQGFEVPTQLPVDHRVGFEITSSSNYHEEQIEFNTSTTSALKQCAQQHHLTFNTLLQGAWALLLSHYSNSDDVVFGVTVSGRQGGLPGIENGIGLFINTLPMRVKVPGNSSLLPWLTDLQAEFVELGQYEHTPLADIQRVSQIPANTRLFDSIVIFENYPAPNSTLTSQGGLAVQQVRPLEQSPYPLTVMIVPGESLQIKVIGEAQSFARDTVARILGHLQTVLESMVANFNQSLWDIAYLTDGERHQLLKWNDNRADFPTDSSISQLFEAQAERSPQAAALKYWDEEWTYDNLNQRANQVAHYLQSLELGSNPVIGVCLQRSPDLVAALLGILKIGAIYLPLDPAYPSERLAWMLEDAQAAALISEQKLGNDLIQSIAANDNKNDGSVNQSIQLVCLEPGAIAQQSAENLDRPIANEIAYVMYTSGSTGTPKGVLGTHRGAINRFAWMWDAYPFEQHEICCQKTSLSFVDSVWEIFGPLLKGVKTVIIPDSILIDSSRLLDMLACDRITRIVLVPSLLQVLLEALAELQYSLPDLKLWITSGEALTPDVCQQFQNRLPNAVLLNLYGSSEVAADVTAYAVSAPQLPVNSLPIGRPIANTEVYILDRHRQPVPINVAGELYIGGAGLAAGYLHRPELTNERFIPHLFCSQTEAKLFKTGDLARYRANGQIEFLGRVDHQVKVRGYRIEVGEIEAVLAQHPDIKASVVTTAQTEYSGDFKLVAYWIRASGQTPTAAALRQFLARKLPGFMIPSSFTRLEEFPLNPNGKVNRLKLAAISVTRNHSIQPFISPKTDMEEKLVEIWKNILQTEQVGVEDNFFDLGGHSLLLMRVHNQLEVRLNSKISIVELFKYSTIRTLAQRLGQPSQESRRVAEQESTSSPKNRKVLMQRQKAVRTRLKTP